MELVWLNGDVVPMDEARVSIHDRGFVFADGVYEVVRLYDNAPFALDLHLDRLQRSCEGLRLVLPIDRDSLVREMRALIKQSNIGSGTLYLQLTRGAAPRNTLFPQNAKPTLLFYARRLSSFPDVGQKLWTVPDERWRKCWIKAIGLTAAVLARNEAEDHGADEAIFVEDGIVSEGSSSNLFIVSAAGELITHPVGPRVLPGITRHVVIECARSFGIHLIERPIPLEEAKRSAEIFLSSTTREVAWASTWDDEIIHARPGPITMKLNEAFAAFVTRELSSHIHRGRD